jgi:hypothetical protein
MTVPSLELWTQNTHRCWSIATERQRTKGSIVIVVMSSSSKKLYSTPSSGKKDAKKKSSTPGSAALADGAGQALGSLRATVLFQSRSASSNVEVAPDKCLLSPAMMKSLQLVPGGLVALRNKDASSPAILFKAWPNKRIAQSQPNSDHVLLHRLWQEHFAGTGDASSSKSVLVQSLHSIT